MHTGPEKFVAINNFLFLYPGERRKKEKVKRKKEKVKREEEREKREEFHRGIKSINQNVYLSEKKYKNTILMR